jgi:membrane-associated phospholipid phosphatase
LPEINPMGPPVRRRLPLRLRSAPRFLSILAALHLGIVFPAAASGQEISGGVGDGPRPSAASALGSELRRYVVDGRAILLAPFDWDARSWTTAAVGVAVVAALTQEDARIDTAISRNRSSRRDAVSRAVTPFGSYAAVAVSVAPLAAGWIFKNAELRDTGRDAIEAELFAAGIVTPLLKKTVGRLRPAQGSDGDEARPLSSGQSFPSGHATEAFAVASVLAARSKGWVVPAVAYTLASGVALARMNDRAHFSSDVVAGALIGTAIGHTVVNRHSSGDRAASWHLVPVGSMAGSRPGYGLAIGFGGP